MLLEWLKAWSVLRLCCGTQMSDAWRTHIVPGATTAPGSFERTAKVRKTRKHRSNQTSVSLSTNTDSANTTTELLTKGLDRVVQLCSAVDLTTAEHNVLNTRLYKRMGHRVPLLSKASDRDGKLSGNYCETCTKNVGCVGWVGWVGE